MALVRDDCLLPTLDAPELGYVRESTTQRYVPDVFYKVRIINLEYLAVSTWCLLLLEIFFGIFCFLLTMQF